MVALRRKHVVRFLLAIPIVWLLAVLVVAIQQRATTTYDEVHAGHEHAALLMPTPQRPLIPDKFEFFGQRIPDHEDGNAILDGKSGPNNRYRNVNDRFDPDQDAQEMFVKNQGNALGNGGDVRLVEADSGAVQDTNNNNHRDSGLGRKSKHLSLLIVKVLCKY